MAKLQVSYTEAQRIIREHLKLSGDCEVVIERKDAQDRRMKRSSQFDNTNIQR